ncbi:MAG: hypothetical protein H6510_06285 [Acidobacteria bacterium]|nr:hypothetical protein [Acidobacteriota bacterium]MCB9397403.1 hypothetical protein [Acidobacteriota bacterium]
MVDTKALDQAFHLFTKQEYAKAKAAFGEILKDENLEPSVRIRVEQFQKMAESRSNGKADALEASVPNVVALLNQGSFDEAEKLLGKAQFEKDLAIFLQAQLEVHRGNVAKAKELLVQAIQMNPDNKGFAINSSVFGPHLKDGLSFLLD